MFFKFVVLLVTLTGILFFIDILLPKLKSNIKYHKDQKVIRKLLKNIKELEIK